jgi:hypothetical protein
VSGPTPKVRLEGKFRGQYRLNWGHVWISLKFSVVGTMAPKYNGTLYLALCMATPPDTG